MFGLCAEVFETESFSVTTHFKLALLTKFGSFRYSNETLALATENSIGVHYHSGGSMKLNACILHLAHMVYS